MTATIFLMVMLGLVLIFAISAIWAGFRAAPYVPTKTADVRRLLSLAEVKPGERVVDLGAGDGRIVIMAAKEFKAEAIGYEISLLPYLIAKLRISWLGSKVLVRVSFKDFFTVDLNQADVVTCFLTPAAMNKLAGKLRRELKPGARIVSYAFHLPGWEPVIKDKPDDRNFAVWVYRVAEHQ